jgi:hypothetical protein
LESGLGILGALRDQSPLRRETDETPKRSTAVEAQSLL